MNMIYTYINAGNEPIYTELMAIEKLRLENENLQLRIKLYELESTTEGGPQYHEGPAVHQQPVQRSRKQMVIEWVDSNPPFNGESTISYYERCDACMPPDSMGISLRAFDIIAKSILLGGNKVQYYRYECTTGIYPVASTDRKDGKWYCN